MRPQLPVLAILAVLAVPPSLAFADGEPPATTTAAPAATDPAAPAAPATPETPAAPVVPTTPPASTTTEPVPTLTTATPTPMPSAGRDPGAPEVTGTDRGTTNRPSAAGRRKARRAAAKAKKDRKGAKAARDGADDATKDADAAKTAKDVLDAPATGLSALSVAQFRIPPFLLPIYQAAGVQYGIRWEVLAAINEIETDYGRNLSVSTAGAQGWMQFMPATWETYGVDANGDGEADPYNPVDAVFAAARYLKAAGGSDDIAKAVFSYNHAGWYVDDVLKRAKAIAGLPADVVSSLTGLTLAQPPVHVRGAEGASKAGDDAASVDAKAGGAVGSDGAAAEGGAGDAKADGATSGDTKAGGAGKTDGGGEATSARARAAKATRRDGLVLRATGPDHWGRIGAPAGSDVVAVQDATVIRLGDGPELGRFIELRDAYGNRYKYAHLGTLATRHLVARPAKTTDDHAHADDESESAVGGAKAADAKDSGSGGSDAAGGSGAGGGGATSGSPDGAASGVGADRASGAATTGSAGAASGVGTDGTTDPVPSAPATAGRTRTTTRRATPRAATTPAASDAGRSPVVALGPARPRTITDDGGPTTGRDGTGPSDDAGLGGSASPAPTSPPASTTAPVIPTVPAAPTAPATDAPAIPTVPATPDPGAAPSAAPSPVPGAGDAGAAPGDAATTPTDGAQPPSTTAVPTTDGIASPGVPAATGAAGVPGQSDAPGLPGAVGADGSTGVPGLPGTTGLPGATGIAGTTGVLAIPGAPGAGTPFGAVPGVALPAAGDPDAAATTILVPVGLLGQALAGPGLPAWQRIARASPRKAAAATEAPTAKAVAPTTDPEGDRVEDVSRWMVRAGSLRRSDVRLRPLRKGSKVLAGSILGTTSTTALRLAIRPAGEGTPRIDPRPIVAGWRLLDDASVFGHDDRSELVADRGDRPDVGRILLMSKAQLQARVLADPKLTIYEAGRDDIRTGAIDRRVLATMEYLTANGLRLSITSLKSGHSILSSSGNVSAHSYGSAMDIAVVDGVPILGHQGAGSITASTIRLLLRLQGTVRPNQIISLMTFAGADNTLAMADHDDHIHVGFPRAATDGDAKLGKQVSAVLRPTQWGRLVDRLADIENPKVPRGVSKAATPAKDAKGETTR